MDTEKLDFSYLQKEVAKAVRKTSNVAYEFIKDVSGKKIYGLILTADPNGILKVPFILNDIKAQGKVKMDLKSLTEYALVFVNASRAGIDYAIEELGKRQYDKMKDKIQPFIMDGKRIKGYLETVPHREYLDFSVVYCYTGESVPYTITDTLAERWGVTEQQLYEDSVKNIVPKGPINMRDMMEQYPASEEEEVRADSVLLETMHLPMYVIYNESKCGSNVILLTEFLEKVSKRLNGDYYLLTGSQGFALVIPKSEKFAGIDGLKEFNEEVTGSFAEDSEKIPAHMYYYRSLSRKLVKM